MNKSDTFLVSANKVLRIYNIISYSVASQKVFCIVLRWWWVTSPATKTAIILKNTTVVAFKKHSCTVPRTAAQFQSNFYLSLENQRSFPHFQWCRDTETIWSLYLDTMVSGEWREMRWAEGPRRYMLLFIHSRVRFRMQSCFTKKRRQIFQVQNKLWDLFWDS